MEYASYWDMPDVAGFPSQGLWWQNFEARLPPASFGGPPPLPATTSYASEASPASYSASATAHASWQVPAGLPGNSGHLEEAIPPSGVVADESARWSRNVELPPVQEEDEVEEDDAMEKEGAPDQESSRGQKMQAGSTTSSPRL